MSSKAQKSEFKKRCEYLGIELPPPLITDFSTGAKHNATKTMRQYIKAIKETYEETLENYRRYFNNKPLMRCLDGADSTDQMLGDKLFKRLREEIIQAPSRRKKPTDSNFILDGYRGELNIRAYWDNVRMQLKIDDDEIAPVEYVEELPKTIVETSDGRRQRPRSMFLVSKTFGSQRYSRMTIGYKKHKKYNH